MIKLRAGEAAGVLPLQGSPSYLDFRSKDFKTRELSVHSAPNGYDGEHRSIRDGGILENYGLFLENYGFLLSQRQVYPLCHTDFRPLILQLYGEFIANLQLFSTRSRAWFSVSL